MFVCSYHRRELIAELAEDERVTLEIARLEEEFRLLTEENHTLVSMYTERTQQLATLRILSQKRQGSSWPLAFCAMVSMNMFQDFFPYEPHMSYIVHLTFNIPLGVLTPTAVQNGELYIMWGQYIKKGGLHIKKSFLWDNYIRFQAVSLTKEGKFLYSTYWLYNIHIMDLQFKITIDK